MVSSLDVLFMRDFNFFSTTFMIPILSGAANISRF